MEHKHSTITIIGSLCGLAAFIGDFVVTSILGYLYPGYHFLYQSQSELGISKSPVAVYMNAWGVIFSILVLVFAYALRKTIFSKGGWQKAAVWMMVIYGLGEGMGSGLFPNDMIGSHYTVSAMMHSIFSGIGDAGIVLLPYCLLKVFPKNKFPKINRMSLFVGISGPVLIICFFLATHHFLPFKGLWQRVYLLDYYVLVITLAVFMKNENFTNTSSY
jgi:hypothetical membrane protein